MLAYDCMAGKRDDIRFDSAWPCSMRECDQKNLVKGVKYRGCLLDKSGAVALPSYRHTPLRFGVVLRFHLAPLALVFQRKETQRADRIRFGAG